MTETNAWQAYETRLARVTAYLHAHLDDPLDMDVLAGIACLSPWHWHRIYRAVHGETVTATIRRLRLQRAAHDLVTGSLPVAALAERAGYDSVAAFTRAFSLSYGMAPATYRRSGGHARYENAIETGDDSMYPTEIRTIDGFDIVAVEHRGPYMEIGRAFETLFGLMTARGAMQPGLRMLALYNDDPDVVPADKLRSLAAFSRPAGLAVDPPLMADRVAGGRYAVLTHKGPYAELHKAYQWLFGTWLPASGQSLRAERNVEVYLNTPMDTPPTGLLTEIWVPIA